jgi:long-chain-acyl-CoA dehydrogenase
MHVRLREREVVPRQHEWDKAGMVDRDIWRIAGQQGVLVPATDPAYGGLGNAVLRDAQYAEEVSHA